MMTTLPNKNTGAKQAPVVDPQVAQMQKRARAIRMRTAMELADRIKIMPDGSRAIVRFSKGDIREHWVLIVTFTTLGLTGLLQRYSDIFLIGWLINTVFGGIDTLRIIHHLAAIIFLGQGLYHAGRILYMWFVKREIGSMLPSIKDMFDMLEMLKFNAGFAKERPKFDRYSIEEKLEYWALLWGTVVMGITGLMQWFPTITTQYLPGIAIAIARLAHSLEAVLAVAAIITWHFYHTMIKERNNSIFDGLMSEHEMKENHTIEYERIIAAYEYIQKVKSGSKPKPTAHPAEEKVQVAESVAAD